MRDTEACDFVCVLLIGLMLVMVVSLLFSLSAPQPYIMTFEWSGQIPVTFKESEQLPIEMEKNNDLDWDNSKKKDEKKSDKKSKVVPAPAYLFSPPSL